jgi:hypothetical protein
MDILGIMTISAKWLTLGLMFTAIAILVILFTKEENNG